MASTAVFAHPAPLSSRISGFERAMIMLGGMMATFMMVLDTTIANVALPHMSTSLGATPETITWVLTSYIVASAISMPLTGWLADRIGRKELFLAAIICFTAASTLCAIATNLPEMVLFRILQGMSGALIMPMCNAILLDISPPDKIVKAMTIFSAGSLVAPVLGPLFGGLLTENFNWRWCFLINIPVGAVCIPMLMRYLPRTPTHARRFDLFGFSLLALALGALQMMLDRGQQQDWFDSWEVWAEAGLVIAAGWMFVVHVMTTRDALFEPAMFKDRNFVTTGLVGVVLGMVVIGGGALLPSMLQGLLRYTVLDSGMMAAPRGIGSIVAMLIASRLNNRVDPRLMIFTGSLLAALSLWFLTGITLDMDQRLVITANFIQGLGLGMTYVPIAVIAFATIAPRLNTSAASVLTLARNLGGSIGISVATTVLARNIQTSHSDLASQITPASMPVLDPSVLGMFGSGGDMAMAMVDAEVNRQAAMIAYVDVYYMMMIATIISLPLVLIMRKANKPAPEDHPMVVE
jgi:MFS transporter, DHA2 family, multidrug resistance protein